jgi:outer membrane protein OmpA-like peptidoglycan-associated protein
MRIILLSALALPSLAHADRRIEVGLALGGHAFSTNTELGVDDEMSEPGPASSALLGLRVAVPVIERLAVEGEAVMIPTDDDVLGDEIDVYGLRAHARFDLLTGRFKPFVVLGAGAHIARSDSPQVDDDTDRAYHWGGGARFAITDKLDARIDIRHLIVPDRTTDGATSDVEVTAGMMYRFGGAPKPKPLPPVIVVVEEPEPAPVPPPPPPPAAKVIEELAGIGFELDSATIDIASAPILEKAYLLLHDNPKITIEISGHTSSEGNEQRNMWLSLERAKAVEKYLVGRGIDEARIEPLGYGSANPIADNVTDEGRRKNRRIEFRILPEGMPTYSDE